MLSHDSPISGIASYKGKYVATAGYDNQVILWEAQPQKAIARGLHDHLANQCAFSHCGNYLVSSSSDGTARIWCVPSMKLKAVLFGHSDDVEGVAFHGSKPLVATSSRDGLIKVFTLDGAHVSTFTGHCADVMSVEWYEDQLVSTSDDGTIRFWDVPSNSALRSISLDNVETDTIAVSDDHLVFGGNDNGQIVVLRDEDADFVDAHEAGIKKLVFCRQRRLLVSLSYDRSFAVWSHRPDGALQKDFAASVGETVWPRSCAMSGDDSIVFSTFGDRYATYSLSQKRWEEQNIASTHGKNAVCSFRGKLHSVGDAGILYSDARRVRDIGSLCNFLCPFDDLLISGGQNAKVYNAVTGESYFQHHSPLNCAVTVSNDRGGFLIVGTYTGEGLVFRRHEAKGLEHVATLRLHENAVKGIAASDRHIFSVCATSAAAFHSSVDFELVKRIERAHDKIANGCVHLGKDVFASVSRDRKLRIWAEYQSREIETRHTASIKCIVAEPNGRRVALGDYTGHISVYDHAAREWLHEFRPTASGISSICWSDTEKAFAASSYDGNVYRF